MPTFNIKRTCPILAIHWCYYLPPYSTVKTQVSKWPALPTVPNPLIQRIGHDPYMPGRVLLEHISNI